LAVLTILKDKSQWEGLSHILWKKCLKPPTSNIFNENKNIELNGGFEKKTLAIFDLQFPPNLNHHLW